MPTLSLNYRIFDQAKIIKIVFTRIVLVKLQRIFYKKTELEFTQWMFSFTLPRLKEGQKRLMCLAKQDEPKPCTSLRNTFFRELATGNTRSKILSRNKQHLKLSLLIYAS